MNEFKLPLRPAALPVSKTCFFKTTADISIPIDIYLPSSSTNLPQPIILFIHGGGWVGGDRLDYPLATFQRLLSAGFIVTSMEYRLLPETPLSGQLSDIRDVEPWLRTKLAVELNDQGVEVDSEKIVVIGASAGAHLALLTPKLFAKPPLAILSLYGPTNLLHLPFLRHGGLAKVLWPPVTPSMLAFATDFSKPPTGTTSPITPADFMKPRGLMAVNIFKSEVVAEFLLHGLVKTEDGKLSLPKKGSVLREDVEEISPLHLLQSGKVVYPPIYQIVGSEDEVFEMQHAEEFDASLKKKGVESQVVAVPGASHAFDAWVDVGSEVDEKILKPAVEWIARIAGVKK